MLKTRGWKYKAFLRYLRIFKYIAFAPKRGEFLESYYTLMRYLDDVTDGDAQLPQGYMDGMQYLSEKIEFARCPAHPRDEIDHLMLYCFQIAEEFGENFQEETEDILNSLLFDAKRRNKLIIFPKKELFHHFHLLDIRGTVKATLKLFKEDPEKYTLLEPLGMACRYQYDIEDFESDVSAGYVNIPQEDCDHFQIGIDDIINMSPQVIDWLEYHGRMGLDLLQEHHRLLTRGNFSLLSRLTFQLVYEFPARKVFKQLPRKHKMLKPRKLDMNYERA